MDEKLNIQTNLEYNTQRRRLPLPEYGRSVHNMVEHAMSLDNREDRQRCAETIVDIMESMFPSPGDAQDYRRKLWDHLAIMSDFKLDIDYPVEVVKKEALHKKPDSIPYPQGNIRYRHYGRYVQDMLQAAIDMPGGEEKDALIYLLAVDMKKEYALWNKDTVTDEKIFEDIFDMSNGAIKIEPEDMVLSDVRQQLRQQGQQQKGSQQKRKQGKGNQKRKY